MEKDCILSVGRSVELNKSTLCSLLFAATPSIKRKKKGELLIGRERENKEKKKNRETYFVFLVLFLLFRVFPSSKGIDWLTSIITTFQGFYYHPHLAIETRYRDDPISIVSWVIQLVITEPPPFVDRNFPQNNIINRSS